MKFNEKKLNLKKIPVFCSQRSSLSSTSGPSKIFETVSRGTAIYEAARCFQSAEMTAASYWHWADILGDILHRTLELRSNQWAKPINLRLVRD